MKKGEERLTSKTRRERERDDRRAMILNAAVEVASQEGIDGLSIRKIASKTEYSPAIIYHYFKNKDEILEQMLHQGYQNILQTLGGAQVVSADPAVRLEDSHRRYIAMALQNPDYYKSFMLSDSSTVLERTAVLFKGAALQRPSLAMACKELKSLAPQCDDDWIELTAQVMWTALFGLCMRLLIEHDLPEQQRTNLIDRHIEFVFGAIKSLVAKDNVVQPS